MFEDRNIAAHPIDIVEDVANSYDWDFQRVNEYQITMAISGQWCVYSIMLSLSRYDYMLRQICTFNINPPKEKLPALYDALNIANNMFWAGSFTHWEENKTMVHKYGLILSDEVIATQEQIDQILTTAIETCERFYPAFQLICWGDTSVKKALDIAMTKAYGHA